MPQIRSVLIVLASSTGQEDSAELSALMCKDCISKLKKRDVSVDLVDLDIESEFYPFDTDRDFSTKIAEYQLRIKRADHVIIFHPTRFYTLPGTLKAWIDEVFVSGFAYTRRRGLISPLLKKVAVSVFIVSDVPGWRIQFIENSGLLRFWKRTFARITGAQVQATLFGNARSNRDKLKESLFKKTTDFVYKLTPDFVAPEVE